MAAQNDTHLVLVDARTHENTRIDTGFGRDRGHDVHLVPVVPREVPLLIANYPVVLVKNAETGEFGLAAMLGFYPDENLFLVDRNWVADYLPLEIQRGPFSVGLREAQQGEDGPQLAVLIDPEHPGVQEDDGEVLFAPGGEQSDYLQRINSILAELVKGAAQTKDFVEMLIERDLVEPMKLDIEFDNGEQIQFEDLYSIHDEKFAALRGESMETLMDKGYLRLAQEIITSLNHVGELVAMKNARLALSSPTHANDRTNQ